MEEGSFLLDVRGYEISAAKYRDSATESVTAGESLKIRNASFCRSLRLNGVGGLIFLVWKIIVLIVAFPSSQYFLHF
jgi:hypothetical protein